MICVIVLSRFSQEFCFLVDHGKVMVDSFVVCISV